MVRDRQHGPVVELNRIQVMGASASGWRGCQLAREEGDNGGSHLGHAL